MKFVYFIIVEKKYNSENSYKFSLLRWLFICPFYLQTISYLFCLLLHNELVIVLSCEYSAWKRLHWTPVFFSTCWLFKTGKSCSNHILQKKIILLRYYSNLSLLNAVHHILQFKNNLITAMIITGGKCVSIVMKWFWFEMWPGHVFFRFTFHTDLHFIYILLAQKRSWTQTQLIKRRRLKIWIFCMTVWRFITRATVAQRWRTTRVYSALPNPN